MTRRTIQLVTRMTKPNPKRRRLLRSSDQLSELMTRAARRDVFPIRLRTRRVTAKTSDVRIHSRRNREPDTTTIAPVTSGASRTVVPRVIEPRIKTPQRWKRFHLSALRVCVTDGADRARRVRELLRVTTCTRRVCSFARQRRLRRIVFTTMA